MALEIVGIAISLPTLLPQVVQGARTPIHICRALKDIPRLLEDLSTLIEDAEECNIRLQSQNFNSPPVNDICLQNSKKLGEIKASKDKIQDRMNGKRGTSPKHSFYCLRIKEKLKKMENELEKITYNILQQGLIVHGTNGLNHAQHNHCHYQLLSAASAIPDMSAASLSLFSSTNAMLLRMKGVWGLVRQRGNLRTYFYMLQVSADSGDNHAVDSLASVRIQGLVPNLERSKFPNLYAQIDGQRKDWKLFIEGVHRLHGTGKYGRKMHVTFAYFNSVVADRNSELRGKASYLAGLCCRFSYYGAPTDPVEAIRFLKIGSEQGVFYSFVDLSASYKNGIGVEVNLGKYSELVQILIERGGMNTQVEEAAFRFQQDRYTNPFQGCDIDCVYKGFCYLNGICVEHDMDKGLKFILKSAKKGHSLAQKILIEYV